MKIIKRYFKIIGSLLIVFIIFSFFINIFSHFDLLNWCYIGIDNDLILGNQKTIKRAIKTLRIQDPASYKNLCKYVDIISERYCINDMISRAALSNQDGCYIKGSKIILLKPERAESDAVVRKRVEAIKKYSAFSKNFWQGMDD